MTPQELLNRYIEALNLLEETRPDCSQQFKKALQQVHDKHQKRQEDFQKLQGDVLKQHSDRYKMTLDVNHERRND